MGIINLENPLFAGILLACIIWDIIWKGLALWKSARNNHRAWFICIVVFNTVGILPIIYLLFQKKESENK